MKIEEGFDGKKTTIRIYPCKNIRKGEMWIKEFGKKDNAETLSYVTIDELLDLKKEIEDTLADICGLNEQ